MNKQISKIMVTKNEYVAIQKKEADEYWKKVFNIDSNANNETIKALKSVYFKEFEDNLDQYEVVPFEHHNSAIRKVLNTYFNTNENRNGYVLYRGWIGDNYSLYNTILNDLNLQTRFDDYYYRAAYNVDSQIIFSYCEGDISLEVAEDKSNFDTLLDELNTFIEKNY